MARLDAAHRQNLVERYFPNASHQVVIFSTDTEVDRQYYKALHPMGVAPVVTDGDLVLAESGAICDYLNVRYGGGRLAPAPKRSTSRRTQD